jgi:4-amino-4-deoxy-L-arabinose transferase-like glycosyltransferase
VARKVNFFSGAPAAGRLDYRPWLIALAALTALRLILAAVLPLSPDEAYYWLWAQHLQPGYFDHPPMAAFWIAAGTAVLGKTTLGVRLLGPLAAAAGSVLLWDAGEQMFPNRHVGLTAAALFNATLISGAGSIIMTPDTPLLFFWAACFAALGRWLASRNDFWWLAVGAAAGAALLSKYTAVLLIAGIGFWLMTSREGRQALRSPWPWAGCVLALLIFAPNIYWNAVHGWVSYLKQGGRAASFDPARSVQYLGELIGSQIGLATPLIFGLAAYGLWHLRRAGSAPATLLLWLTLLPAAVFLEHVLSGRIEPNWPAIIFIPGCLAAAALPPEFLKTWRAPAIGLGFLCNLAVYAQALAAPFPIPASADPAALQLAGWPDLIMNVASEKPGFLTSDDYTTLSEIAWVAPPGIPVIAAGIRWQSLSLPAAPPQSAGISVSHRENTLCPIKLGTRLRNRANDSVMKYFLCRMTLPQAAVLVSPP